MSASRGRSDLPSSPSSLRSGRTEAWPSGHERKMRKTAWFSGFEPHVVCSRHELKDTLAAPVVLALSQRRARRVAADLLLWRACGGARGGGAAETT
jgi:hypothetical protein